MSECHFQILIGAYYDRELDREAAAKVEAHLAGCAICTGELAGMGDLSARISTAASWSGMDRAESARLHRAVRDAGEEVSDSLSLPLFRTMGLLGALAASVLIVSGVWLLDMKSELNSSVTGGHPVALAPEWERVATTGYADPSPGLMGDTFFSPRYAVDWMLDDLTLMEHKPWVKPKSF